MFNVVVWFVRALMCDVVWCVWCWRCSCVCACWVVALFCLNVCVLFAMCCVMLYGVCLSCCLCVLVCVSFRVLVRGACGLSFGSVWRVCFVCGCVFVYVVIYALVSFVRD